MNNQKLQKGNQSKGKEFTGKVVPSNMAKTAIVEVSYVRRHPLYHKIMRRTKRLSVQNDNYELHPGDQVKIKEVRPLSKTKHFKIIEKIILDKKAV